MILLTLCLLVAGQADDLSSLEDRVGVLLRHDLYDEAASVLKAFAAEQASRAADPTFKDLRSKVDTFAKEADALYQTLMAEAASHVQAERFPEAIRSAARARRIYPERRSKVEAFQADIRDRLDGKLMVKIPSRACWIGEKPLRQVQRPAFLIDLHPVTNESYAAYVDATGAAPPAHWWGGRVPKGRERHPVVMMTWEEAAAYAKWAGKRLPSAEEWEIAARGDDRREFPWGDAFQEREGEFNCNSLEYWQVNKTRSPGPTPVGELATPSAGGVWMGGNVWEWTSTAVPGKVGARPVEFRILKGGSFMTPARAVRCASVLPENPALSHPDVGFRCAKDAP
ncbi:MAG TPA: SUMF1/EgtB/PvdO family nonheme iron enzyme [Planctomycetota bacterium]|nr:SUMF1/EgtB/PvdO family nonheme iron enzyme [Planctomycetota bacterium]